MTLVLDPEYVRRQERCRRYGHAIVLPTPEQVQRIVCGCCGASWSWDELPNIRAAAQVAA